MRVKAKQMAVLLPITFLLVLSGLACTRDEAPSSPNRIAESLSFDHALENKHVLMKRFALGPIARAGLLPKARASLSPVTSFDSDPIEALPGSEIILSMGMLSLGAEISEADQPVFRVDLVGPKGKKTLLEVTGQRDFALDEWWRSRIRIPNDLGTPVRIRFTVTPTDSTGTNAGSAIPVWGVPRLIASSQIARPNVLFVVFDTLRADHMSPYDYERDTTPFLTQLAARGAIANELVATYPTTLSSHWSMFTGLFPARHGVYPGVGGRSAPSESILAKNFQEAGYRTSAFTEGGFVHSIFGFATGFDLYHNSPKDKIHDLSGSAKSTFDLALDWLTEAKDDPFFMFLHTYQVHTPYEPSEPYRQQFAQSDYQGRWLERYPALVSFQINNRKIDLSEEEFAHILNLYDAEIRELDDLFASFWSELEALDILDNTIIVITSDHGEDFVEHGWINHGTTLYDPALLVPLIIIAPDQVPAGTRLRCQRSSTDLMPTVLELAGLEIPTGLDGRSMASELKRGACEGDHPAFSELLNATYGFQEDLPIVSLRSEGWKLIRHIKSGELEAYDLRKDPDERVSIPDDVAPELIEALDAYIATRPDYVAEEEREVPQKLRESLKALGYVE
jgi:arylsulfatase A-like enzyme